jgi:hypothetical protein
MRTICNWLHLTAFRQTLSSIGDDLTFLSPGLGGQEALAQSGRTDIIDAGGGVTSVVTTSVDSVCDRKEEDGLCSVNRRLTIRLSSTRHLLKFGEFGEPSFIFHARVPNRHVVSGGYSTLLRRCI